MSAQDVIRILRSFGFEVYSQRGSHIKLERIVNGQPQRLVVAGHGSKTLKTGTLLSIYRDACRFIPESQLHDLFYSP